MRSTELLVKKVTVLVLFLFLYSSILYCQQKENKSKENISDTSGFQNSLSIRPIDIFLSIYTIEYERKLDSKNGLVIGLYYFKTNSNSNYPGTYQFFPLILGYSRYLWKSLYLEYSLLPGYARYNDTNENKISNSFELWNELHIGYRFEFEAFNIPLFIDPQLLLGFNLFKSNQPHSFKVIDNDPKYFYPNKLYIFPNLNLGFRF